MEYSMFKIAMRSILVLLFLPLIVLAGDYKEGQHYQVLPDAVRTRDASKIEVVELFWYGCSHCFRFEPLLQKWETSLGKDVDFWQSPAMWNEPMKLHARAFYVIESLGLADKKVREMHHAMFDALNVSGKKLASKGELAEFFASHGISQEDFNKAFDSFGVGSKVNLADARARSYKISGTPELVVNGKYRVSGSMAGSAADMLKVVDHLIAMERVKMGKSK